MKKLVVFFLCIFLAVIVQAGDVHIHDWSVNFIETLADYKTYRVNVTLRNSGSSSGDYVVYLNGEDSSGYPIVKERVRIETYMMPFGEIKDTAEVIIRKSDADAVKTWVLKISRR